MKNAKDQPIKILMVHKFFYVEGGAERYIFNLTDLLQSKGHQVIPFAAHHPNNYDTPYDKYFADSFTSGTHLKRQSIVNKTRSVLQFISNRDAQKKLTQLIRDTKPDVAHVHSIYHHLTPSILQTLKAHDIPIMLTLHDYKLICPNYILMNGKRRICTSCHGKKFYQATLNKCFRDSRAASLLISAEAYVHRLKHSYQDNVDLFVSPSRFLGDAVKHQGYPTKPFRIQPYTLDTNLYKPCYTPSDYFIFLGRLTHEKGLDFLFNAMKRINGRLLVVGTGPLEEILKQRVEREHLNIQMLGYKQGDELRRLIADARFTVVPSEWHDNSPLVIYESLALGNAVIGTRMGGIPELITEGVDGYTFERGDIDDFVDKTNRLLENPNQTIDMGKRGRGKVEALYSYDQHYRKIIDLYNLTMKLHFKQQRA